MEAQLNQLEQQLRETLNAENFFETGSGKLIQQLFVDEITRLTREVTSDKFLKDHVGYVNTVAELIAYKTILKKLQVAGSPVRKAKIQRKMDELNGGE